MSVVIGPRAIGPVSSEDAHNVLEERISGDRHVAAIGPGALVDSPPLVVPAFFIGTGAARSGLISSMGMGKTIVEFWFDPMSRSVCM